MSLLLADFNNVGFKDELATKSTAGQIATKNAQLRPDLVVTVPF